jgi:porphobilinogen synthase
MRISRAARLTAHAAGSSRVQLPLPDRGYSYKGSFPGVRPAAHAARRVLAPDDARDDADAGRLHLPGVRAGRHGREEPVESLPGVSRKSFDRLARDAEACVELGVPAIALFPVIPPSSRAPTRRRHGAPTTSFRARCARSRRASRRSASSPTSRSTRTRATGRTASIDASGYVMNDETVEALVQAGALPREAGATWSRRRT